MKVTTEVSAGGVVYKKTPEGVLWLVTQNSAHKGWSFPKGRIGDKVRDELPEVAALREVEEEGGIKAKIILEKPFETHYTYRFRNYLIKKTVYFFLMEYVSGDIQDHDYEVSGIRFAPAAEVMQTLSYKDDKKIFSRVIKSFPHI